MAPLTKRLPREFKHNLGKYLGIFLLMCSTIAMTSGFLLASHSISVIIKDAPSTYKIEDGHFITSFKASNTQLDAAKKAVEDDGGLNVYEDFFYKADFDKAKGDDGTNRSLRVYNLDARKDVNVSALAEGKHPAAADEIALDRVFAASNDLAVGSKVKVDGVTFKVVGIVTLPDNQALFANNSDFTINTLTFGVAEVSNAGFAAIGNAGYTPNYSYAYRFKNKKLTLAERIDLETDMVSKLSAADATVTDLVDADSNQGISYAAEDVEGDSAMWVVLLEIIIAIMAFVFVVLTNATIEDESAVIGTLLASGYSKREVLLHYMALPSLVGVLAAVVGTALGLTLFAAPMQSLYYGSYSLPPYHTSWDWGIFGQTVALPVAVLVGITFVGLLLKIGHTPLQFLRHELGKNGTRRGFQLPEKLGFVSRFRLRVFLRNFGNFATLFIGIGFATLLMLFSLCILPTMQKYASNLRKNMVAEHQYSLKAPLELEGTDAEREAWKAVDELQDVDAAKLSDVEGAARAYQDAGTALQTAATAVQATPTAEAAQAAQSAQDAFDSAQSAFNEQVDALAKDLGKTRDETTDMLEKIEDVDASDENVHPVNTVDNGSAKIAQAEKYAQYALDHDRGNGNGTESVTVYGVSESSRYWDDLNVGDGNVVCGAGLIDKFGWKQGDHINLYDKYEDKHRQITFKGDTWGSLSDMAIYMSLDDFNEFFGNDASYFNAYASNRELKLDARYLASELTPSDMDAIGDQFTGMMEDMIGMLVGVSIFTYLIFMYLLTKAIIDRSARSISYMKVFGYRDREISQLYVRSITITVVLSLLLCLPLIISSLTLIFRGMLLQYNGNIEIYVPLWAMGACVAAGLATYLLVAALHLRSIKKVPLEIALKVQE